MQHAGVSKVDEQQQLFVAAQVSGSLAGAALHRHGAWREVVIQAFISLTFTAFATPALCTYYQIENPVYCALLGYFDGAFGYLVMMALSTWIQQSNIVSKLLSRFEKAP